MRPMVNGAYQASAVLLALWIIVLSFGAAFGGDDVSNWWALASLLGVAMFLGLRVEKQRPLTSLLLVAATGVATAMVTVWAIIPPILAVILLGCGIAKVRRTRGQAQA